MKQSEHKDQPGMAEQVQALQPFDKFNQELRDQVHPAGWRNPTADSPYHLVVIGAGTAGLVTAAGAAGLGARVALVERELMGGDCLNVGCVPSKALLSAGRVAAQVRKANEFGIQVAQPNVDFAAIMERMRRLRAGISPADSAQRFAGLGVDVFLGNAEFLDSETVVVSQEDGQQAKLQFKKAVIATGARASAPEIPGLNEVDYLTNESVFSLTSAPKRLGVIGSGPIGCEMAQAFARFGSEVVLFERGERILPREDPEAAEVLQRQMLHEGVQIELRASHMELKPDSDGGARISIQQLGNRKTETVDQLLVAVGRAPNVEGLHLERVDVAVDAAGVEVNDHLQTTNPRIFAAGDVCSKFKFTHAADFMARIVIQNALFALGPFGRKKMSDLVIPWATYTSPEVAHVGIMPTEKQDSDAGEAFSSHGCDTYIQRLDEVDRAILDGEEQGFVKVHTAKGSDRIIGATIVAEHAGDLISEIALAMTHGIGLGKIASTIHPYPTQADAIRKLGDQFNRTKLTPLNKRILGFLQRLNVGR